MVAGLATCVVPVTLSGTFPVLTIASYSACDIHLPTVVVCIALLAPWYDIVVKQIYKYYSNTFIVFHFLQLKSIYKNIEFISGF
jgi:hypothetical protein